MKFPVQVTIDANLMSGFILGLLVGSTFWLALIAFFFKWLLHK